MTGDDRTEQIRARAHLIWESEGRPGDRDRVHWDIAQRIIDEEDRQPNGDSDLLDKAVETSFPASDPLAVTQPNTGIANDPRAEETLDSQASGGQEEASRR